MIFFLMIRRPPRSTLLPSTPLFQSTTSSSALNASLPDSGASFETYGISPGDIARTTAAPRKFAVVSSVESSRSEEHTSELQSRQYIECRLLLDKKKKL